MAFEKRRQSAPDVEFSKPVLGYELELHAVRDHVIVFVAAVVQTPVLRTTNIMQGFPAVTAFEPLFCCALLLHSFAP